MFRSISVLLNEPDAENGALAHAGEWSSRLRLPLRVLEWPLSAPDLGVQQFFRPFELCVFDDGLPGALRETLLARLARSPQTSALIGPRSWRPVSRVLVLNQHARPGDLFLDTAAAVCRAFQVTPILLTAAHSEAEARSRERFAEEAFARRRLTVDCDFVAGGDVTTAVARAARWRRCSHVLVEQRSLPRWRRWFGGDVIRELAALPDSPGLVAVQATAAPSAPGEGATSGRTGFLIDSKR